VKKLSKKAKKAFALVQLCAKLISMGRDKPISKKEKTMKIKGYNPEQTKELPKGKLTVKETNYGWCAYIAGKRIAGAKVYRHELEYEMLSTYGVVI
jgi:hypothetical protein